MFKLCIWMNIPSHYQADFFRALNLHDNVDLQVRYFERVPRWRVAEGWCDHHVCQPYEQYVDDLARPADLLATLDDGEDRIHIISGNFNSELVDYFCLQHLQWCHWSEMPGIRLESLLGNRTRLYRLLNPVMLAIKRKEGRRIEDYAFGVFGQGVLAGRAFRHMGVGSKKIADLYYAPSALPESDPSEQVTTFAKGRKIFLSVGALCGRKGIDVLLKAFAKLDADGWCLVLCGRDKSKGAYQSLAKKLSVEDRVLFLGAYSSDRISEVYTAADVFVLASRFDGWGVVLNEAASLSLPLIGTDICGASWHVIEQGINGFRVKTASVGGLRNAMQAYVDEPDLLEMHGALSKEIFFRGFSPEKNVARLIEALQAWWDGRVAKIVTFKLCIWMNIPSHHQAAFFRALDSRADVDLQVRYFEKVLPMRIAEGWDDDYAYQTFEQYVGGAVRVSDLLATLDDAEDRIHIISRSFHPGLVDYFSSHHLQWCHWSEMSGIRLADLMRYHTLIFRVLYPLMLFSKRGEGRRIKNHALGAFGQGCLARHAFRLMGVPKRMISDLYYVPSALHEAERCPEMVDFSEGRKIFLTVGALCRRKGTDILLKAFAKLDTEDWCLVLCGLDRADGIYQQLARELGIQDRTLFLGSYSAGRIAEVYSAADVFILPSRFDGWGAVLNEASSVGLPIIGTDLCGASLHIIEPGVNGFRAKAGSVGKLMNAMQAYVDEPELMAKHGAASKKLFMREFTPERNAKRMIDSIKAWGLQQRNGSYVSPQPISDQRAIRPEKISVIIPTYKRLTLLKRAVDSVFEQTHDNWELIISDNENPAAETWDYLTELAGKSLRVKVFQNMEGSGLPSNINNALKHARGEWVKPLFDDDELMPTCLETFLLAVKDHPTVVLAGCLSYRARPNKRDHVGKKPTRMDIEIVEQKYAHLAMYLQDYDCGGQPTDMFIRKTAIDAGASMPNPPSIIGADDSYWYGEILRHGARLHLALPLVKEYQGDHDSITSTLGCDIPEVELSQYRRDIYNYIPEELNPPSLEVIEQMVYGIRGLYKFFVCWDFSGGLEGVSKIHHPQALLLVVKWCMRKAFPGYFTTTPRKRFRLPDF